MTFKPYLNKLNFKSDRKFYPEYESNYSLAQQGIGSLNRQFSQEDIQTARKHMKDA